MATLDYKRYHDGAAVSRTNDYILNGHGDAAPERVNRYVTDGHGGNAPYFAHFCPKEPELATAYMNTLRANYEAQNAHRAVIRGESKRRDVSHLQFFVSFAEHEDVPVEEMLKMAEQLIFQTPLQNHACVVVPHLNTWRPDDPENPGNKHLHISVCPYPLAEDTKKLAMNDRLKWEMQKTMDHICAAHGYSIIENPVLLADPEYKEWFDQVKADGKVTIHPYHPERRQRRTHRSNQRNAASRVREYNRAEARAYNLMRRLDIRTVAELERHIQGVGGDICTLRKDTAYQTRILDTQAPLLAIIEQWECKRSPSAKDALRAAGVRSERDIEDIKYKAEAARARLAKNDELLTARKKEYGQLKRASHILDEDMWHAIALGENPYVDYDSDVERIRRANAKMQKWLDEDEERLRRVTEEENKKVFFVNPRFVSTETKKPYRVCRYYSITGEELSRTEVLLCLAMCVIKEEHDRWMPATISPEQQQVIYAKPDKKIQMMIDALEIAREENILVPADIQRRIHEVGDDKERFKRLKALEYCLALSETEKFVYGPEYSSLEQKIRGAHSRTRPEPAQTEKERPSR